MSGSRNNFFAQTDLLGLFDFLLVFETFRSEASISRNLHGKLVVFVVDPSLVENVELLNLASAEFFIRDPDQQERITREVNLE